MVEVIVSARSIKKADLESKSAKKPNGKGKEKATITKTKTTVVKEKTKPKTKKDKPVKLSMSKVKMLGLTASLKSAGAGKRRRCARLSDFHDSSVCVADSACAWEAISKKCMTKTERARLLQKTLTELRKKYPGQTKAPSDTTYIVVMVFDLLKSNCDTDLKCILDLPSELDDFSWKLYDGRYLALQAAINDETDEYFYSERDEEILSMAGKGAYILAIELKKWTNYNWAQVDKLVKKVKGGKAITVTKKTKYEKSILRGSLNLDDPRASSKAQEQDRISDVRKKIANYKRKILSGSAPWQYDLVEDGMYHFYFYLGESDAPSESGKKNFLNKQKIEFKNYVGVPVELSFSKIKPLGRWNES